jgi:hypothetical protein
VADRVVARTLTAPPGETTHWTAAVMLGAVQAVLDEYVDHLPLTIRQIFYRLVGARGYAKTEQAYARLCETLNRARRAGMISFTAIRDDGTIIRTPQAWDSADDMIAAAIATAKDFRLDRQRGQPRRLIFCVEAAGMVPQIERIAAPYGIPVHSSGGFDSLTAKYDLARLLAGWRCAEVLHIGDHDPSGVHVFKSLAADVTAMAERINPGAEIEFTRLAVTPKQAADMNLPSAPAKDTDRRAFSGETWQVEALPPDVLAEIVEQAIVAWRDPDAAGALLAEESEIRQALIKRLAALGGG